MRFEVEISKEGVDKLLDCLIKSRLEYDKLYIYEKKKGDGETAIGGNLTAKAGDFGSCLTPEEDLYYKLDTNTPLIQSHEGRSL